MFTTDTQVIYENVLAGQAYSLPFDWLDNSQIHVYGDSQELAEETHYTLNRGSQSITPKFAYSKLVILRDTLEATLSYNFKNSKGLRSEDLQNALDQVKQLAEEGATQSLKVNSEGLFDAQGKRIENVGDPENPRDAVHKAAFDSIKYEFEKNIEAYESGKQYIIDAGLLDSQFFDRVFDGGGVYILTIDRVIDGMTPSTTLVTTTVDGGGVWGG